MTTSDVENLKVFFADKFNDLKERHAKLENDLPRIAKEQAQSVINQTAFIKPIEKWTVVIALIGVLGMAFGSYGKLSTIMDRFERLEKRIEQKQVIENSDWISTNKKKFDKTLQSLESRLRENELQIRLLKSSGHFTR
jgi:hypothetical protein